MRPVAETSTRVLALMKGDIDATDSYLPTDQVERIEKEDGVHVARDESMRIFLIRMNNKKPPFDNINARKCFSYAFNYDGFIGTILKDFAERNPAPIPKNLWGYPQDVEGYSFDLEKAKEYCDKARGRRRRSGSRDRDPHPERPRPDHPGGPAVPERPLEARHQHQVRRRHLAAT